MRNINYLFPKLLRKVFNPPAVNDSTLTKTSKCDVGTVVNSSSLGRCSYIGEYTSLLYTDVGDFCSISNHCAIGGASHPMDWASMSPAFNSTKGLMRKKYACIPYDPFKRTCIGNDVWIGSYCQIKAGVSIGNGAVIGMGSVVTKDIGPYEIWAGNPAKLIRKRFDDDTIEKLLLSKWWELTDEELSCVAQYVNNIDEFLQKVEELKGEGK